MKQKPILWHVTFPAANGAPVHHMHAVDSLGLATIVQDDAELGRAVRLAAGGAMQANMNDGTIIGIVRVQ